MRKPFWKQRTFWASLAGVLSAVASQLDPAHQELLLSVAAMLGCLGSVTARAGASREGPEASE